MSLHATKTSQTWARSKSGGECDHASTAGGKVRYGTSPDGRCYCAKFHRKYLHFEVLKNGHKKIEQEVLKQCLLQPWKTVLTSLLVCTKVSDHEHSKVLESSHSQLLSNKLKIYFWIHISHVLVFIILACTKKCHYYYYVVRPCNMLIFAAPN